MIWQLTTRYERMRIVHNILCNKLIFDALHIDEILMVWFKHYIYTNLKRTF